MEDTSLLPNPIIISIKSKTAFQFIELKDRDTLVENLLLRLKQVKASKPAVYNTSKGKDMVLHIWPVLTVHCTHFANVSGARNFFINKHLLIASLLKVDRYMKFSFWHCCEIHKGRRDLKWKFNVKDPHRPAGEEAGRYSSFIHFQWEECSKSSPKDVGKKDLHSALYFC